METDRIEKMKQKVEWNPLLVELKTLLFVCVVKLIFTSISSSKQAYFQAVES